MEKNTGWKRIVYLMCAIQVGAGIAMIGVMAFLPLFLGEIGVTDAGEAAFWAGLISGVTPFMIALSAPFWSIQADRRGPKLVMSIVLAAVTLTAFLCAVSTSPWQVFIFRLLQGLVGGFVPIGLSLLPYLRKKKRPARSVTFRRPWCQALCSALLWEVLWRIHWGTACPLFSLASCPSSV